MLVGIHQSHYLPWLRYVEKIARCDVFIVLDTAQFVKGDWHNRNKIKTAAGTQVLTVPVEQHLGQTLFETRIDNRQRWQEKHWRAIEQNYAAAPYFGHYHQVLENFYHQPYEKLHALNRDMLKVWLAWLGIATRVQFASALPPTAGSPSEKLVQLCQAVGGDGYYCGRYAAEQYLDRSAFEKSGVRIQIQDWNSPPYAQRYLKAAGMLPDLAILDLLMNEGPRSVGILRAGAAAT